MDSDTQKLLAERKRLLARVGQIDQFFKLRAELLGGETDDHGQENTLAVALAPTASKRDQIIAASRLALADGRRKNTRELLTILEAQGIEVGGNDPAMNLSAYLSREKQIFSPDRKFGWGLVQP